MIRDQRDRILLVKPTYRDEWTLPGGVVEEAETPDQTCAREVLEELDLKIQPTRLLVVDWAPPFGKRPRPFIYFIFYCDTITDDDSVTLQDDELEDYGFFLPSRAGRPPGRAARGTTYTGSRTSGGDWDHDLPTAPGRLPPLARGSGLAFAGPGHGRGWWGQRLRPGRAGRIHRWQSWSSKDWGRETASAMMAEAKRTPSGRHENHPEFFHPRVVARLLSALGQATLHAATNDDQRQPAPRLDLRLAAEAVTGLSLALHQTPPGEQPVAVAGEIVAWTRTTLETLRDQLHDREWTFCPCGEQHGQTDTDDAVLAAVSDDLLLLPP